MNNYRETKTEKNVEPLRFSVEHRFPLSDQKRIVSALPSDCRRWPVSRKHSDCIIKGEQLLANALEKGVFIAPGEIPPPNPFAEENIAADDDVLIEEVKA